MAARTQKIRHDEQTRAKIKAALIIGRLQDHIFGTIELEPTQVSSAKILLGKVLPDLKLRDSEGAGEDGTLVFQNVYEAKPDGLG